MLTKLIVKNFKNLEDCEIELGNPVVFIGPNNSGKTSALQALALWELGLRRWLEKRKGKGAPEKRPGVTINRKDLYSVPVPSANLLWSGLHVREGVKNGSGPATKNVLIELTVEGVTGGKGWRCGFEFDYANEESFYCRPVRLGDGQRMPVPDSVDWVRVAFLPPMSGLAAEEYLKQKGEINLSVGQGRTAEVLRNLCWSLCWDDEQQWGALKENIQRMFGVQMNDPVYVEERSELVLTYRDRDGVKLDISSSGRGLQQVLLLLAYMRANRGATLLLDEPDAHLEILRQREIYRLLADEANALDCQIVAASHSEVILNEAAERDVVVAFVGRPHRINDRGAQAQKALREIGFEDYYQAELRGWVLYLEGSTDLKILQSFAKRLGHRAQDALTSPFVSYVGNDLQQARRHFFGLSEARRNLSGFLLCDQVDRELQAHNRLLERMWHQREIENYLCQPETLRAYAGSLVKNEPLFGQGAVEQMDIAIRRRVPLAALEDRSDRWWRSTKMSEEFLDPLFDDFYQSLGLTNIMRKSNFHELAEYVPHQLIDPEVTEILDAIYSVSQRAEI